MMGMDSMCRLIPKLVICVVFYFLTISSWANFLPETINFRHVAQNQDIVLGEIRDVFQDKEVSHTM